MNQIQIIMKSAPMGYRFVTEIEFLNLINLLKNLNFPPNIVNQIIGKTSDVMQYFRDNPIREENIAMLAVLPSNLVSWKRVYEPLFRAGPGGTDKAIKESSIPFRPGTTTEVYIILNVTLSHEPLKSKTTAAPFHISIGEFMAIARHLVPEHASISFTKLRRGGEVRHNIKKIPFEEIIYASYAASV